MIYANKRTSTKFALKFKGKGKHWEIFINTILIAQNEVRSGFKKMGRKKITLYAAFGKTPFGQGLIKDAAIVSNVSSAGRHTATHAKRFNRKKIGQENE